MRGERERELGGGVHCHLLDLVKLGRLVVPGRHGRLGKAWTPSGQG